MRTLLTILFGLSLALTPVVAFAQPGGIGGTDGTGGSGGIGGTQEVQSNGIKLINPLAVDSLEEFLAEILKFIVRLGTLVVIVMIVVVGFMFVAARGNPEAISKARTALLWTLVGAVILIGAEIIAQAIAETVIAIGS